MISEAITGRLPSGWRATTLGKLCQGAGGSIHVGSGSVESSEYSVTDRPNAVCQGDILLNRRGDLSRMALVGGPDSFEQDSGYLIVRLGNSPMNPRFARHYLSHPAVQDWLARQAVGASMPHLNKSIVSALPVVVPPSRTQHEIADVLEAVDQKIISNQKLTSTLHETSQAIFLKLLHSRERQPECWRRTSLRQCCERIENGRTPARSQRDFWIPGTIPWLSSSELKHGIVTETREFISDKGMVECGLKLWPVGTTVIGLCGTTAGHVALLDAPVVANQACCGLVADEPSRLFIYAFLREKTGELKRLAKGTAQQNLNQQTVANFSIEMPTAEILRQFNETQKFFIAKMAECIRMNEMLELLRVELVRGLFSGEIRPGQNRRRGKLNVKKWAPAASE